MGVYILELIQNIQRLTQSKIPENDSTGYLYFRINEIIEKLQDSGLHNLHFWDKSDVAEKLQHVISILRSDDQDIDDDKIDEIIEVLDEVVDEINEQMKLIEERSSQHGGQKKKTKRNNKRNNKRRAKYTRKYRTRSRGRGRAKK